MHRQSGSAATNILFGVVVFVVVCAGIAAIGLAVWRIWYGEGPGSYRGGGKQFAYDLSELRKTDPDLIICQEDRPAIETGLQHSRGIAAGADGRIHVAGDQAVRTFDRSGNLLQEFKLSRPAGCLAVGGDGIYVAMTDHLERIAPSGARRTGWRSPDPKAVFTSVAATGEEVFVADAGNRVVLRFDKSGKLLGRIGRKDKSRNIPGFVIPSPYFDVAMAADGLLRVTNPGRHRIEAYTVQGDLELGWGRFSPTADGFCGCCNPVNFAILPDGEVVTCEKGLTRVKIHDAEGNFLGVVAGPESFKKHDELVNNSPYRTFGALDVAAGADGRILILDPQTNEVRTFRRTREKSAALSRGKP